MGKNIRRLLLKYRDIIFYAFFGICTTLVNIFAYWFLSRYLSLPSIAATVVAWMIAVVFAFVTNRKWVFHSVEFGICNIAREMLSFFVCRLVTGGIDVFFMWLFVDILYFDDVIIKTVSNILVIIFNYIASRYVVFRDGKSSERGAEHGLRGNSR